jgi:hypothetical protein
VQRSDQLLHLLEGGGDKRGLLLARVGAFSDADIQPEGGQRVLRQRAVTDEPAAGLDFLEHDGRDRGILVQNTRRQLVHRPGEGRCKPSAWGRSRELNRNHGHDGLLGFEVEPI